MLNQPLPSGLYKIFAVVIKEKFHEIVDVSKKTTVTRSWLANNFPFVKRFVATSMPSP